MNLKEITKQRRTTKKYDPERKISDQDWNEIVDFMHNSPTSMNWQTWRAIVIDRESELMKSITEPIFMFNINKAKEASKVIVFIAPNQKAFDKRDFIVKRIMNNMELENTRTDAKSTTVEITEAAALERANGTLEYMNQWGITDYVEWAKRQSYIALGFGSIAATNLGIDTTMMEGMNPLEMDKLLLEHGYITDEETSVLALAFGYRKDESAFNKTNRDSKDIKFTTVK